MELDWGREKCVEGGGRWEERGNIISYEDSEEEWEWESVGVGASNGCGCCH